MPKLYSVRDMFLTFQGEGARAGTRAIFLRFAGCNMWNGNPEDRSKGAGACARWCDTDFRASMARKLSAEKIAHHLDLMWPWDGKVHNPDRWVVVTGGEPLLQFDVDLAFVLKDHGWRIAVETNGTVNPGACALRLIDHLCVSPKLKADGTTPDLVLVTAEELKVVLPGAVGKHVGWSDEALIELADDGDWEEMYVQPLDPTDPSTVEVTVLRGGYAAPKELDRATDRCLKWVTEHPEWRVGIQMQKVFNLP